MADRLKPKRLSGSPEDWLATHPRWYAQEKIDGQSGILEFDNSGVARMWRTKTEVTQNLPHLQVAALAGSAFLVEWAVGHPSRASDVTTLLSRGGWMRIKGARIYLLDAMTFNGQDWTTEPYYERVELLETAVERMAGNPWPLLVTMPRCTEFGDSPKQQAACIDFWVSEGGEGAVLRDRDAPYEVGYSSYALKYKPMKEADAWVRGYVPGTGKFQGLAGSLILEMEDRKGRLVEVGRCSGLTDAERKLTTARLERGEEFAVEVSYQRVTSGGKLRHAQFRRIRNDKGRADCSQAAQLG